MQDELVDGDIDLQRLRELLVVARARGFGDLSAWADITIQWAEETNAKFARLRPKSGQAHIDGNTLVSAEGRRYCLTHTSFELHDDRRCIRCEEIEA
jgi:hypothetical protein